MHEILEFINDALYMLCLAATIAFQFVSFLFMYKFQNDLENQCKPITIYTLGLVADAGTMLILVPMSAIISYSVRCKAFDMITTITTMFSTAWLLYSGFGNITGSLTCHSNSYPFVYTIIMLVANAVLGLFIMFFGAKHGRRMSRMRSRSLSRIVDPEPEEERYAFNYGYVPRLNRFLSLER